MWCSFHTHPLIFLLSVPSGKTLVFVTAVLQQLEEETPVRTRALILAPTRELATQIQQELVRFSAYLDWVHYQVLIGGTPYSQTVRGLRGRPPHIVIGTPGRVAETVRKGDLDVSHLRFFIVDECDKILWDSEGGLAMRGEVQSIYLKTPVTKQTLMFTATLNEHVVRVCNRFLVNPVEVSVSSDSKLTLHGLSQYFVSVSEETKNRKLIEVLDAIGGVNQLVIFVRSASRARALCDLLQGAGCPASFVHGRLSLPVRLRRFGDFKRSVHRFLVSTDLYGRGIDVNGVNVVINYDIPSDTDTYLHRVGRAGRFGTKGLAISFVSSSEDRSQLEAIQKRFEFAIPALPADLGEVDFSKLVL